MIPKSVKRFSEQIMLKPKRKAGDSDMLTTKQNVLRRSGTR